VVEWQTSLELRSAIAGAIREFASPDIAQLKKKNLNAPRYLSGLCFRPKFLNCKIKYQIQR